VTTAVHVMTTHDAATAAAGAWRFTVVDRTALGLCHHGRDDTRDGMHCRRGLRSRWDEVAVFG
jgi:hypothetical protein